MSSTNRGGKRSAADNYPTPAFCTRRLIEKLDFPVSGLWMEPCAGEGAIISAVDDALQQAERPNVQWGACELRTECGPALEGLTKGRVLIEDFLAVDEVLVRQTLGRLPDVIISNPPFSLAGAVIDHSLALAPRVIMLLRMAFIASAKRHNFMQNNMPDLYVLPNRPNFTLQGTDSCDYAWFVWDRMKEQKQVGRVHLLDLTPVHERRNLALSK